MPPPTRYRATIETVTTERQGGAPALVHLALRVIEPRGLARWIYDSFPLRDRRLPHHVQLAAMRRFLALLHVAAVQIYPDVRIELDSLRGIELLVDVKMGTSPTGFPFSRIVAYSTPAKRPSQDNSATPTHARNRRQPCNDQARRADKETAAHLQIGHGNRSTPPLAP